MTPREREYTNSSSEILDAAERVAMRLGAGKITIDAVACEVGMSKGGVLYNFPSKEALLKGMLERMIETFDPIIDSYREEFKARPNPTLRAVIRASCRKRENIDDSLAMSILAASAQNPGLLEPVRKKHAARWLQIQAECKDETTAAILWAATDGLMFNALLGVAPYDVDNKPDFIEKFEALIEHA